MRSILPLLVLLVACGGTRQRDAQEPAPWRTQDGKQETRLEMAGDFLDVGEIEMALTLLTLAQQEGAEGPELELLLGRAHYTQRLFGEAEPHLEAAKAGAPKDPRPWAALGLLYADTGRMNEAIEALRHAVELDPEDAASWNNLGFLLYTTRRAPEAVPALQKAVTLDGRNKRYQRNLGFALFNEGRVDDARNAFRVADTPADVEYNLGVAYELAGDTRTAATHYRRSLELAPDHDKAAQAVHRLAETPAPETP